MAKSNSIQRMFYIDYGTLGEENSEIEKNSGTQFAPEVAEMMLQMIDEDVEYAMHA